MYVQTDGFQNSPSPQIIDTSEQSEVMSVDIDNDKQSNKSNNINLNADISNGIILRCCCAISFYCICFSIIKPCSYWNSETLDSIHDHGNIFYTQKLSFNNQHLTESMIIQQAF